MNTHTDIYIYQSVVNGERSYSCRPEPFNLWQFIKRPLPRAPHKNQLSQTNRKLPAHGQQIKMLESGRISYFSACPHVDLRRIQMESDLSGFS